MNRRGFLGLVLATGAAAAVGVAAGSTDDTTDVDEEPPTPRHPNPYLDPSAVNPVNP